MVIAESAVDDAAARVFARAHRGGELFRKAEALGYLALLREAGGEGPGWTFVPAQPLFDAGRHGAAGGEWLFRVGLWVPREHREEFLAWYEQEHLPILLECPLWDGCRFVEVEDATGCRFIALHQLADQAALSSPERARSRATPWFARLKQFPWFDEPFTRALYRRVASSAG